MILCVDINQQLQHIFWVFQRQSFLLVRQELLSWMLFCRITIRHRCVVLNDLVFLLPEFYHFPLLSVLVLVGYDIEWILFTESCQRMGGLEGFWRWSVQQLECWSFCQGCQGNGEFSCCHGHLMMTAFTDAASCVCRTAYCIKPRLSRRNSKHTLNFI